MLMGANFDVSLINTSINLDLNAFSSLSKQLCHSLIKMTMRW